MKATSPGTPDRGRETFSTTRRRIEDNYSDVVLVFQGGGALGAYQAGVHEALAQASLPLTWVAGISIGAINCAVIAGNAPERRAERLRAFWERITDRVNWPWIPPGDDMRGLYNQLASWAAIAWGQPGFFEPRFPVPQLQPPGSQGAISYYDTSALRETLEEFVDFDLLNNGPVRLSVGAVNVRSGNFVYFDNRERAIGPEHIMASGALPPGFPPVEIEGELYWDGGLVSNTPLSYVLGCMPERMLIFQVDLFSARGTVPRTMQEVEEREKDIRYSSRTRLNTDIFKRVQALRHTIGALLDKLPPELLDTPEARELAACRERVHVNICHLIYRRKLYDKAYKDYEFSRNSMIDHWEAGRSCMVRTLRHAEWFDPPDDSSGVVTHDVTRDARD